MKLAVLTSHPVQYQAPLFRELAKHLDLQVYFSHQSQGRDQAKAGFGVNFNWDIDLLDGYASKYLRNIAARPGIDFWGCNNPDIERELKLFNPKILLLTGWHLLSYWQGVWAAKKNNIRVWVKSDSQVATARSKPKRMLKGMIYPRLLNQFDLCCYAGSRSKDYFQSYGVPAEHLFWLPHVIDASRFCKAAGLELDKKREIKAALKIPESAQIVLFVGKYINKKRPLDIIYALSRSRNRERLFGLFVGAGQLEKDMIKLSKELRVNIVNAGFINQTQLPLYYAVSDCLALPSDGGETWGLVVNEAMTCGIPAVVSDQAGCAPDLVEEGKTGCVFPMGNIAALSDAIDQCLSFSGKSITREALRHKMNEYDLNYHVQRIVDKCRD